MNKTLKECKKGNHKLRAIYRHYEPRDDVYVVIRYCDTCGAVVGDVDYDGRTAAGMAFTMITSDLQKNTVRNLKI